MSHVITHPVNKTAHTGINQFHVASQAQRPVGNMFNDCDSYTYTAWGPCQRIPCQYGDPTCFAGSTWGKQTRQVVSKSPSNCQYTQCSDPYGSSTGTGCRPYGIQPGPLTQACPLDK